MNNFSIDDLASPQLTEGQQQAIAFLSAMEVDLSIDSILKEATETTGLSDFGADDFKERIAVLINEWNDDKQISTVGRFSLRNKLLQDARNRLLLNEQWQKHPEILDIEIEKPIVIAGLPRSGTTHLLNLLAADSRLRAMPYWLSCEPVQPLAERQLVFDNYQQDPRYQRCAQGWEAMKAMVPALAIMHPMSPDHIHEEIEIMNPNFSASNYEWMTPSPKWRDYYLSHDQIPHYEYMKNVLKLYTWQQQNSKQHNDKSQRWVLKCIQHLEQLPALKHVFPDATVIYTHRDPVAVVQSIITMLGYGQRMNRQQPELDNLLEYWSERIEILLRSSLQHRHLFSEQQSVDVLFHEFMQDNMATMHKVYNRAGLDIEPQTQKEFEHYIENHKRGKDGSIIYKLERDFGITPEQLRKRFDFYFNQFDIQAEP